MAVLTGVRVPELDAFDDLMTRGIARNGIPLAGLAIARRGHLVFARGYSLDSVPQAQRAQPTSLSRFASCSKSITNLLIQKFLDDGTLAKDAFLMDLVSWTRLDGSAVPFSSRWAFVTIDQLLRHHSGWSEAGIGGTANVNPLVETDAVLDRVRQFKPGATRPITLQQAVSFGLEQEPVLSPGQNSGYANFNYGVLGLLVEAVTGKSYVDSVKTLLFSPLRIHRALQARSLKAFARPEEVFYDTVGTAKNAMADQPPQVPVGYGDVNLEIGTATGGMLLSAPAFAELLASYHSVRGYPAPAPGVKPAPGSGGLWDPDRWEPVLNVDNSPPGVATYCKNGSLDGTQTAIVHRSDDLSFAFWCNSSRKAWPNDLIADANAGQQWLNYQLNATAATIARWPEHRFPPAPVWEIDANGFRGTLEIASMDADGNIAGAFRTGSGTTPIQGLWEQKSRRLTFTRQLSFPDAATCQVYRGHLLDVPGAKNHPLDAQPTLAGTFEAAAGVGITAARNRFGWIAHVPPPPIIVGS